jgi:hypothetical protein
MRAAVCAAGGDVRAHKLTVIADLSGLALRHVAPSTLSLIQKRARLEEDM